MFVNIVVHAFLECVLINLRHHSNGERQKRGLSVYVPAGLGRKVDNRRIVF